MTRTPRPSVAGFCHQLKCVFHRLRCQRVHEAHQFRLIARLCHQAHTSTVTIRLTEKAKIAVQKFCAMSLG